MLSLHMRLPCLLDYFLPNLHILVYLHPSRNVLFGIGRGDSHITGVCFAIAIHIHEIKELTIEQ